MRDDDNDDDNGLTTRGIEDRYQVDMSTSFVRRRSWDKCEFIQRLDSLPVSDTDTKVDFRKFF